MSGRMDEKFWQFLEEELRELGIASRSIEFLRRIRPKDGTKRRAKLVRVERIERSSSSREPIVRISQASAIFQVKSVPISLTKWMTVWRQDDEIVLFRMRVGKGRVRPRTKRIIAQKIPSVRAIRLHVEQIVRSTSSSLTVLNFQSRQPSIALSADILRTEPLVVHVRIGRWRTELSSSDWKQILKVWKAKYPLIERRWAEIEVSADGERWFRLTDLVR